VPTAAGKSMKKISYINQKETSKFTRSKSSYVVALLAFCINCADNLKFNSEGGSGKCS
jgi:hypothetical protein